MLSDNHSKTSNLFDSPVTFVTHKHFAILFFLLSCYTHLYKYIGVYLTFMARHCSTGAFKLL